MTNQEKTMEKIVALCKGRGFIFAGSEIYGGLANTWDYGPLGAELKNNIKRAWWKKFVQENPYNVGLDAAILMNPQTWVASGHLAGFSDPLMDCRECHERFRADQVIENWCGESGFTLEKPIDAFTQQEMKEFIEHHAIPCPTCGKHNWTDIRQFNLMFKTFQGVTEESLRLRDHDPEELSFYSKATTDFEFLFPFGWGELWGVADRTNYDLTRHQETSGKDLTYFDQEKNEHYLPYVIEPSLGVERTVLSVLCDAYDEEVVDAEKNDVRTVLRLHPALAPFKCAVLPLSKKLSDPARKLCEELTKDFMVDFDDAGSIGKRYRRQDEIGTPFCVTVDFQTVGSDTEPADGCVTIRERDSMDQVRIPMSDVKDYISQRIAF